MPVETDVVATPILACILHDAPRGWSSMHMRTKHADAAYKYKPAMMLGLLTVSQHYNISVDWLWTTINALGTKAVSSEAGAFMFAFIIY